MTLLNARRSDILLSEPLHTSEFSKAGLHLLRDISADTEMSPLRGCETSGHKTAVSSTYKIYESSHLRVLYTLRRPQKAPGGDTSRRTKRKVRREKASRLFMFTTEVKSSAYHLLNTIYATFNNASNKIGNCVTKYRCYLVIHEGGNKRANT